MIIIGTRITPRPLQTTRRVSSRSKANRRRLPQSPSIPNHSPALHLNINRFHTLHIHHSGHTGLKDQLHQVMLFHRQFAEGLQHVVWAQYCRISALVWHWLPSLPDIKICFGELRPMLPLQLESLCDAGLLSRRTGTDSFSAFAATALAFLNIWYMMCPNIG